MSWRETLLAQRLGLRVPIVQAPMAGASTPKLAAAVSEAGGLGSIAGAMLSPDALREAIRAVRDATSGPFAVNVFAPLPPPSTDRLEEWARLTGADVPEPRPVPRYDDQLQVVVEERVPVLSFTFGIPDLQGVDAVTVGTATTVEEAIALERAGVDAIAVQGYEAGGHRGTFLAPVDRSLVGTIVLVPQVIDAVTVPVIAAGGIMDGRGIAAALALGADAAQLGSAFLRADEAATGPEFRAALGQSTVVTRVLTGRYARAIRTPTVDALEASGVEPPDYPLPRGFLPGAPWLAGQGSAAARSLPAGELVEQLTAETDEAIRRLAKNARP